jgi:hypothetical protein
VARVAILLVAVGADVEPNGICQNFQQILTPMSDLQIRPTMKIFELILIQE